MSTRTKRYVQFTVEGSPQFGPYKDKGQVNDPALCLWCGNVLRRYVNEKATGHNGMGHRGDNAFCSMRCGYSYGVLKAKAQYNPAQ